MENIKYELTSDDLKTRKKIRKAIIDQLKTMNAYKEPFADMVERYMEMWDICLSLEHDIKLRGVQVFNEKTGYKKNDSVALLTNLNKQMLIFLDKMGVSMAKANLEDGKDI